ncbi:MAG: hypothetical protein KGI37_09420 [Alphaproteobacteria bacterium]|nr:hypothetical protein [Alphaproteobacteria bacterium]
MTAINAVTASDSNVTLADNATAATPARGIILHDQDSSPTTTTTMSFGDFLDMINPLQHIPVISSIYRAVTGDTINPVPRIAGDALYGGAMGVVSAGIGALAAIGDEALAANDGGKSAAGTLIAAITGDDKATPSQPAAPVKLAATQPASPPSPAPAATAVAKTASAPVAVAAATSTPAPSPAGVAPTTAIITPTTPPDVLARTVASAYAAAQHKAGATTQGNRLQQAAAAAQSTSDPDLGLALNTSALPYGGIMDPKLLQNAMQNQAMALAMANKQGILATAHSIRNSRFAVAHPATTSATATTTAATAPTSALPSANRAVATAGPTPLDSTPVPTTAAITANASQGLPLPLRSDARALKGLNMYREHAAVIMPMVSVPSGPLNGFAN